MAGAISNTYGHELIDELVIGLSSDPLVAKPDVVDVVKQLLPGTNCFQKQIRSEKTLLKYGAGNTCFCKICVVFCGAKKVDETLKRVEILSAQLRADSAESGGGGSYFLLVLLRTGSVDSRPRALGSNSAVHKVDNKSSSI